MMQRQSIARRAIVPGIFAALLSAAAPSLSAPSLSAPSLGAPLPPVRPNDLSAPLEPAAPSPDSPAPAGRIPVDVDVNALPLYNLPTASRERMRECGEAWRNLKLAGQSDGMIWRSFADKCLSR